MEAFLGTPVFFLELFEYVVLFNSYILFKMLEAPTLPEPQPVTQLKDYTLDRHRAAALSTKITLIIQKSLF